MAPLLILSLLAATGELAGGDLFEQPMAEQTLAERVHSTFDKAVQGWTRRHASQLAKTVDTVRVIAVFTVEATLDGELREVALSLPSAVIPCEDLITDVLPPPTTNAEADAAPDAVQPAPTTADAAVASDEDIEPSPPPEPPSTFCVVRVEVIDRGRTPTVAAVCLSGDDLPQVVGWDGGYDIEEKDPSTALFDGWRAEARGAMPRARGSFNAAVRIDPFWDLAGLALALSMARSGQLEDARQQLARNGTPNRLSEEIHRLIEGETEVGGPTGPRESQYFKKSGVDSTGADAAFGRCERDPAEIQTYVQQAFNPLMDCVEAEQKRRPDVNVPAMLPVSFVVKPSGALARVMIDHRFYREGPLLACAQGAVTTPLTEHSGGDCPVAFTLQVQTIRFTEER